MHRVQPAIPYLFLLSLTLPLACSDDATTTAATTPPTGTTTTPVDPGTTDAATEPTTGTTTTGVTVTTDVDLTSTTAVAPTTSTGGTKFDVGNEETEGGTGNECQPAVADATLTGIVYAPNQVIPVSGALVYATDVIPDGVPDQVYCAECVQLACDTPFALTEPDGSFNLAVPSGSQYLVVQKGQFMRVTAIEVAPGPNPQSADVTSLPGHRDPANGLYTPNIALALGEYDRLEDALAKLGLADTYIDNNVYTETFVEGTQEFDIWDNSDFPIYNTLGSIADLVADYETLQKYHILFVPCSSDPYMWDFEDEAIKENLRNWVAAGGKFYVSDWSSEYLSAAFDQYQTFYLDKDYGSPDLLTDFDSLGTVLDPDMLAWLGALPPEIKDINPQNGGFSTHPVISMLPEIQTVDNWSGVAATPMVLVDDGMGGQVDVGHKTWIEGPGDGYNVPATPNPLTITGHYGCGKIMFTSYHMAEFNDSYVGLTPQELVLLYLILEIGVCQDAYEPPPPPK